MRMSRRVGIHSSKMAVKPGISYTGAYTMRNVTWNSRQYEEYQMTGSGTLTVTGGPIAGCAVWLCGGGARGSTQPDCHGGAGARAASNTNAMLNGTYAVTVGAGSTSTAAGGTSSLGTLLSATGGQNSGATQSGGTGGGRCGAGTVFAGDGQTNKRPFNDTVNFPSVYCAGGGAGGYSDRINLPATYLRGGNGGTNGGSGAVGASVTSITTATPGTGGATGGGNGGNPNTGAAGSAGTTPGSGGGGGSRNAVVGGSTTQSPGNGYRGVVILRIPA